MPSGDSTEDVTLFLAGDVMTGRGIDQVLPNPSDPVLYEDYVKSALGYVSLAEEAGGRIPRSVGFEYVWGDALAELDRRRPAVRLVNLETAVTTSDDAAVKGINYRLHPHNATVISAAGIDCCVLANNHVLDWGAAGLRETLKTLKGIDVATTGAGRDLEMAKRPAVLRITDGRVVVLAFASPTAGVPLSWAPGVGHPGVNLLPDLDDRALRDIAEQVRRFRYSGDLIVVSIHWGGNWGYEIPDAQREFAHALIDEAGVDVVWGHSSHHPKAMEVHHGRLILYGCGDFLNDYEGISGYESFRDDLVLMYLPTLARPAGELRRLTLVPFRIRQFRLQRASGEDTQWLAGTLNREGDRYGTGVDIDTDDTLVLKWEEAMC